MTDDDPIVAEVRATRKRIEAANGNEFTLFYKRMMELQQHYSHRLVISPLPVRAITWSLQKTMIQDAADSV